MSELFASAAALSVLAPESNCTFAPGNLASSAATGDCGNQTCAIHPAEGRPGASTCADPLPDIIPSFACGPITAIDFTAALFSGSSPLAFFKSTALCSSTLSVVARLPSTSGTPFCVG